MQTRALITALLASTALISACTFVTPEEDVIVQTEIVQNGDEILNLGAVWTGAYSGLPAFDRMDMAGLEEAFENARAANLAEIDLITANAAPADFDNTILALEDTGRELSRVQTYYGVWSSNLSSPEFREIEARVEPEMSAFYSQISQNQALFDRVSAVRNGPEYAELTSVQQRLTEQVFKSFTRNGATLQGDAKTRYAAINQELSTLYTDFSNNVLSDEESYVLYLTEDQTGGLPASFLGAAAAAETREHPGEYAVVNTRSSMEPFLTYSTERALREQVWTTYYSRGDNGDEHDNNAIIADILKLRHERVGLLGYANYASWRLENRMAQSPDRANALMEQVWQASIARVGEEVADMQAIADLNGDAITIAPWDYRFYAEKVRRDRYDLDSEEVAQYLQLDNLREAMFDVAGELFRFNFQPVPEGSVPVFHPDVKVWEVTDADTGAHIGLWYLDPFARAGKRSGAWATTYRSHEAFKGEPTTVLASNNSNFSKPAPGEPVLISWTDANTFFHEFGHALHYLSSEVDYPTHNSGLRDYTEFQSQLLERWLLTDRVIKNYLVHAETGAPMPDELVAKIRTASTFNQGFATTEYLASALIDMKLHTMNPDGIDPDAFERETLAALGLPAEIVMRHRTPQFGHVFSGEGYAAGYYGYMWADVLTADAAEAFAEAPGGFYDRDVADRAVKYLFTVGNTIDPAEAYRMFRGRDASIDALMRDRGFMADEEE